MLTGIFPSSLTLEPHRENLVPSPPGPRRNLAAGRLRGAARGGCATHRHGHRHRGHSAGTGADRGGRTRAGHPRRPGRGGDPHGGDHRAHRAAGAVPGLVDDEGPRRHRRRGGRGRGAGVDRHGHHRLRQRLRLPALRLPGRGWEECRGRRGAAGPLRQRPGHRRARPARGECPLWLDPVAAVRSGGLRHPAALHRGGGVHLRPDGGGRRVAALRPRSAAGRAVQGRLGARHR